MQFNNMAGFPKGFTNGVSIRGIPVLSSYSTSAGPNNTINSGVYWVNSVTGNDSVGGGGLGGTYVNPFKTVVRALVVAKAYDIIMVQPGHVETIVAAGTWTMATNGVSIVGLGAGSLRPTVTWTTATTATVLVTGQGCSIENMNFTANFASLVNMFAVQGADFQFRNNTVNQNNATNAATTAITTTAAGTRMLVDNNVFGTDLGTSTQAILLVGGDGHQITNNWFESAYSSGVGAIAQTTTTTTRCLVFNNFINNLTASCTKAMVFTSASTGLIANNRMQILSGSAPITGAAMSWVGGNYYSATIANAGTLI